MAHGLPVRLSGVGERDSQDRLTRLLQVADIAFAENENLKDRLQITVQLESLARLPKGWCEGDGDVYPAEPLNWAGTVLQAIVDVGTPLPYVYPTPEGHVRAEWSFVDAEVSLDIDLVGRRGAGFGLQLRSRADREQTFSLETADDMAAVADFVLSFAPDGTGGR